MRPGVRRGAAATAGEADHVGHGGIGASTILSICSMPWLHQLEGSGLIGQGAAVEPTGVLLREKDS